MNMEKSNTCMKCENAFTKGHLDVCAAKEEICNICKNFVNQKGEGQL